MTGNTTGCIPLGYLGIRDNIGKNLGKEDCSDVMHALQTISEFFLYVFFLKTQKLVVVGVIRVPITSSLLSLAPRFERGLAIAFFFSSFLSSSFCPVYPPSRSRG